MKDRLIPGNFRGAERAYFEWSNQVPAPAIWIQFEAPALRTAILEVADKKGTNLKVLDVGVGGGKVLGLLEELGIPAGNITGIDLNAGILKLVAGIQPQVTLRQGDIAQKSVLSKLADKGPFDAITASMVLNHLSDIRLKHAAENIFNLLRDGGSFIALVPYPENPEKRRELEVQRMEVTKVEDAPWGGQVIYHHRALGLYMEYFDRIGFYTHLRAELKPVGRVSNRLLICGIKNTAFRKAIERDSVVGVQRIDRQAYIKGAHLGS